MGNCNDTKLATGPGTVITEIKNDINISSDLSPAVANMFVANIA